MNEVPGRDVIIFTEALRLPFEERAAYLEQACADDEDLRREVQALLDAHERVGTFLETPPPKTEPCDPAGGDAGKDEAKPGRNDRETENE